MELEMDKEGPKSAAKVARPSAYQPGVALEFFKTFGKMEAVPPGKAIFAENEGGASIFSSGSKMYFLLDGVVELSVKKKPIGLVPKGEVFGEMASISQLPRSATATAKTACKIIALDEKQFLGAMEKSPEFALMLMTIIIGRLRETVSNLTSGGKLTDKDQWSKASIFERKLLTDLQRELEDKPPQMHPLNKVIVKEGDRGVFMYLVIDGVVAITIQEKPVEKIGPGGVFGEMALVDQSQRVATAMAETDCTLLAINRNDFMDLVKARPAFAMALLKSLAERLRFMTSKYTQ
jgi:CRP/FNR family transcriptional regulator, cyclic AMP receptor protein